MIFAEIQTCFSDFPPNHPNSTDLSTDKKGRASLPQSFLEENIIFVDPQTGSCMEYNRPAEGLTMKTEVV